MLNHFTSRLIAACYIMALLFVTIPTVAPAQTIQKLVIFNWDEYLDPEVVEQFEAEFNVDVVEAYYESDETRTEKLIETDGRGYDLILTSDDDLGKYIKRGWVAPLDEQRLPNLKHIDPRFRQGYAGAERYVVPFAYGTTGIAYRTDLVTTPITSWKQFFTPTAELAGRISMTGDSRDLISMALKSLGYSANSVEPDQLQQVERLLLAQKPHVRSYDYLSVDEDSAIVRGEVVAAMIYNADAQMMAEYSDKLVYVLPEEGGALWIDCFVLGSSAKNHEMAYAFLNFINEPVNAVKLATYACFASPNKAAEKLLPQDFLENSVIYPDQASLKNSEYVTPLSPRGERQRNAIASRVTR